jgi:hypothetical protein
MSIIREWSAPFRVFPEARNFQNFAVCHSDTRTKIETNLTKLDS